MSTPLLTTKLYILPGRPDPSTTLRTGLVSRPRLIEQLNAGLHRKLTLISAPAGFGKTRDALPPSKWKATSPTQAQAGGRPAMGAMRPFVARLARGPALFAHRHRSWWGRRGGGRFDLCEGRYWV